MQAVDAIAVLGGLRMIFEETDVAVGFLPNRPGELGRAAAKLGEHRINIDYSYCGVDPETNKGMIIFGVDHLTKAAHLLDELAGRSAEPVPESKS